MVVLTLALLLCKLFSGNASRPPERSGEQRRRWRSCCSRLKMRGATQSSIKTRWGPPLGSSSAGAAEGSPPSPAHSLSGGKNEQPAASAETSAGGVGGGSDPSQRLPQEAAEGAGRCYRDSGRHEPGSQHSEEQAEVGAWVFTRRLLTVMESVQLLCPTHSSFSFKGATCLSACVRWIAPPWTATMRWPRRLKLLSLQQNKCGRKGEWWPQMAFKQQYFLRGFSIMRLTMIL